MTLMSPEKIGSRPFYTGPAKERYTAQEWFQRDLEDIFTPRWHFAGHVSELTEPGAFITYRIGNEELFITRRADQSIAAYHNVCPHRGHPMVSEDRGTLGRNVMCQYHGWTFSKADGVCLSATRMPEGTDVSQWSLRKAWAEEFYGLIFVSIARERPVAITELTADFVTPESGFMGYDFSKMKVIGTSHLEIGANWKIVVENDHECYHCALNHPELAVFYNGGDPFAGFTVVQDLDNPQHLFSEDEWSIIEVGPAQSDRVCKVLAPRVPGSEADDPPDVQLFWQPSGHVTMLRDHAWLWSIRALGPEKTVLTQYWFVNEAAQEGVDYTTDTVKFLFDTTMRQDRTLCERVHNGMKSSAYEPGPLNPHHQAPAIEFYRWYQNCLDQAAQQSGRSVG